MDRELQLDQSKIKEAGGSRTDLKRQEELEGLGGARGIRGSKKK